MLKIPLKPLSVNDAWKGRKFSTPEKKMFEISLREYLEGTELEGEAPYEIQFNFYISMMQDWDNCVKVAQDTICEFYGINDRDIHRAIIHKIPVPRGDEWFEVDIFSITTQKSL